MIAGLTRTAQPDWLARINSENIDSTAFPQVDVLRDSVYYPCSEFDGKPVASLAGNFLSFVYVDYGYTEEQLIEALNGKGFLGYALIAHRPVEPTELAPEGWAVPPFESADGNPGQHLDWIKPPFCKWLIFERLKEYGDEHGPKKFSLLFLCADAVAAYNAMYNGNHLFPAVVAVIRPGHGFGMNWTDFTDPQKVFARTVANNPAGAPAFLFCEDNAVGALLKQPCWPVYSEHLYTTQGSGISLWKRP